MHSVHTSVRSYDAAVFVVVVSVRIMVPQLFAFDHFIIIKFLMFTHMEIPINTML